jgi:DNA helicase-2/ATP-dependent DNA helicase PcrA
MDESGVKGLEEERRLAYVGITRARKKSYISYVANRRMYGSWVNSIPSRFVDELPAEHVDVQAETGLYTPGRSSHWDSSGFAGGRLQTQERGHIGLERRSADGEYSTGDRVFHEKFGNGTIIHIDGSKIDIKFDHAGQKRVMDSFITKAG